MFEGFIGALVLACTFAFGWAMSAGTIGNECKKLGGFWVNGDVYECKLKEKKS
jgi:hypothetical protein